MATRKVPSLDGSNKVHQKYLPDHLEKTSVYRHSAEALRHKMRTNQNATWVHLGDSTGNAADEWVILSTKAFGADFPNMRVTHELWNDSTQTYDSPSVYQPGVVDANGAAVVLRDTFTRSGSTIANTAADTGQVWPSTASGATNGTQWTVGTPSYIMHDVNPLGPNGLKVTARLILPVGFTGPARVHAIATTGEEIFAEIAVSGSAYQLNLFKRVGGTASNLGTAPAVFGSTASEQTVDLSLTVLNKALEAIATIGAETRNRTATLTEADTWAGFTDTSARRINITGSTMKVDEITAGTAGSVGTLRVINGSKPGAVLGYHQSRLGIMVPVAPDLLTLSSSHNHGTETPETLQATITAVVNTLAATYPNMGVAVSSQNPEFSPAWSSSAIINAHLERIKSLRPYAAAKGWGYIAAAEKFLTRADRGLAWVMADGIHPDAANGSPAWRDAALKYLRG